MSASTELRTPSSRPNADLLQFDGKVRRVWKSPLYLVALTLVASVMLLLPVVYFGMVAGVGYAIYWHATAHFDLVRAPENGWLQVIIYTLPLAIGPILLLFMIKPIFARPMSVDRRVSLLRDNEPRLFAFVDAVCEAVGAATPTRIDIDCDVNASASLRRGLLSLFGRDLVLTIGMPLVAGLTLNQFAGILAHEFGHFTQSVAMRLTFIIGWVNSWFARVVYERDSWDAKIVELQTNEDGSYALIFVACQWLIWISRRSLLLLMHVGHAASCVMSRQMEYDADCYFARVVGARQFDNTFDRIALLDVAHDLVIDDLIEAWKDHRLGDDLPGLIAAKVDEMPKDLREAVDASVKKQKTQIFSTHPTDIARRKRVHKEEAPGVFHAEAPASALFMNFEEGCKGITRIIYNGFLGPHFRPEQLISTDAMKKRRRNIARAESAASRYFCGCLTMLRPLRVDPYAQNGKLSPKETLATLRGAREALAKSASVMKKTYKRLTDAENLAANAQVARLLARKAIKFDPKELGIKEPTELCARKAADEAVRTKESAEDSICEMEKVFRQRLESSLALLKVEQVAKRMKHADALFRRSRTLLSALSLVNGVGGELTRLRNGLPELRVLGMLFSANEEDESLFHGLVTGMDSRNEMVLDLRRMLREHAYPFEHADGAITMAQYAIPEMPSRQDVPGLHNLVVDCLDNMDTLYVRCMGELALIAEKVEASVGLRIQKAAPSTLE